MEGEQSERLSYACLPAAGRWCLASAGWLIGMAWLGLACPGPAGGAVVNLVANGDFANGLDGWTTEGPVVESSQFAVLSDVDFGGSSVFQSVDVRNAGVVQFEARFSIFTDGMSSVVPPGTLPDTAFGTLYAGDEPFGPTLGGSVFSEATGLFDLDSGGLRGLPPSARVTPRADRPGWSEVVLEFESSRPFLTLAFELAGENGVAEDSALAIDDVAVVAIPEASAGAMAIAGWLGLVALASRRRGPDSPRGTTNRGLGGR